MTWSIYDEYLRRMLELMKRIGRCFLFLRENAGTSKSKWWKARERKSERKVASQALIISGDLLKLICLRLSSSYMTIIISITWYYSYHFTLCIHVGVRVIRQLMHFMRAQVHTSEYITVSLLPTKLLETMWFLIILVQRTSLYRMFFPLFLVQISPQNPGKISPQHMMLEREYLLSRVYLLRKQKFFFSFYKHLPS